MFFHEARPIWLEGLQATMNVQAIFTVRFALDAGRLLDKARIAITASTFYQLYVNEAFAGYGPARAPHGAIRVDEIDVTGMLRAGENEIVVKVAGYYCPSMYAVKNLSFLCAELRCGEEAVVWTGRDFTGARDAARLQKVMRYSYQRTFSEVYDLARAPIPYPVLPVRLHDICWLPRGVALPDYTIVAPEAIAGEGGLAHDSSMPLTRGRHVHAATGGIPGFAEAELERAPLFEFQQYRFAPDVGAPRPFGGFTLGRDRYAVLDFARCRTGFIRLRCTAEEDCDLLVAFDESLEDGVIGQRRADMTNLVAYAHLQAGTAYDLESIEVYGMRFAMILAVGGALHLEDFSLRGYGYPLEPQQIPTVDHDLRLIFDAARETYRQNTLDVYMDCPTRERAGWLCDSYYLAISERAFTGASVVERAFMENYRLYTRCGNIPKGMLPMCYPADHATGNYIPQWNLWFVLQLDQFLRRCPDVDPASYRELCYGMLGFFEQFVNSDGLLERLPGWNFIEWSRANDWVFDVNYPTNMLYAAALEILGRLYRDPALLEQCAGIRRAVREKSFNGRYFVDHAIRNGRGVLGNAGNISEVCQYYALRFGAVEPDSPLYKELKRRMLEGFGPCSAASEDPDIEPANALMGVYLRMELLLEWGEYDRLLEEIKAGFLHMAQKTGTLWENTRMTNSLNHGFASYAGAAILFALDALKQ